MAVAYPGAELQLENPVSTRAIVRHVWAILHTIVGTVAGSLSGRHYHFYVRADGSVVQRQDVALRSAASVQANPYSVAIVAEDKGPAFPAWTGSNVPPYTNAQVDTIVKILVWYYRRYGMPPEAVRDTCLGGARGTCWHRLGIDGNWPRWPSIFRGRENPACLGTSLSTGKPCPGDNRIRQINYVIIPRVIAILRGLPPVPEEDDLTPEQAAQLDKIERRLDVVFGAFRMNAEWDKWSGNLPGRVDALYGMRGDLKDTAPSRIVKGDGAATWWVLTPNGRRSAVDRGHVNFLVELGLADAEPQDAKGDYQPFVVTQAELDKVPVVAPLS